MLLQRGSRLSRPLRHPALQCLHLARRFLRERPRPSRAAESVYTIDNPVVARNWPPLEQTGDPMTPKRCRDIMFHLHVQEMERMRQKRTFPMPKVQPGDLVEVRYELSRSQETTATFQGFCIEVRNKFLNSGFVLKNTYDGVGVEQLVPRYSPRVLNRSKYSQGKRMLWRFHTPQRPGIMSLEPKIRAELKNLRRRYQMQRVEAQLPPYIFPGPYNLTRRQTREVKAERFRRMLIYAWDERQQRELKKKRLRDKHKWGTYKIDKEPARTALAELPAYHPLSENLPK